MKVRHVKDIAADIDIGSLRRKIKELEEKISSLEISVGVLIKDKLKPMMLGGEINAEEIRETVEKASQEERPI